MNVFTSCTCGREIAVTENRASTHLGCPPAPKSKADQLLDQFTALVAKVAAPDYRPHPHDDLNLTALQDKIDTLDNQPPALGAAALWYATRYGWPVFPLRPLQKVPATKHGFKEASTDPQQIKQWWTDMPNANIGLPTGHAFDVIDVDLPDGPASWQEMRNAPGALDVYGQAQTSSGGRHFLVKPTGLGNKAGIRPGIDYRGEGGYIVAAPSWLGDRAHAWSWITKPSPTITGKPAT